MSLLLTVKMYQLLPRVVEEMPRLDLESVMSEISIILKVVK